MIGEKEIRDFLSQSGLKQGQLAEMLGVSQPTVSRWLKGAVPEPAQQDALQRMIDSASTGATSFRPTSKLSDRELPVFSAVEGGPGAMVVSTEPIDSMPRPAYLMGIKDAFAVLVVGESMRPKFEPGEIAIVHPRYPVERGKPAIFIGGEAQGEFRAMIKTLIGQSEKAWKVEQYNPPREFELQKKDWPRALRVKGAQN